MSTIQTKLFKITHFRCTGKMVRYREKIDKKYDQLIYLNFLKCFFFLILIKKIFRKKNARATSKIKQYATLCGVCVKPHTKQTIYFIMCKCCWFWRRLSFFLSDPRYILFLDLSLWRIENVTLRTCVRAVFRNKWMCLFFFFF